INPDQRANIKILAASSCVDCLNCAEAFRNALDGLPGWTVSVDTTLDSFDGKYGLSMVTKDLERPPVAASVVVRALSALMLPHSRDVWDHLSPQETVLLVLPAS